MATGHALKQSKLNWPQTYLRYTGIYAIGVGVLVTSAGFTHEMNKYGMGMLLKDLDSMGPLGDIWRNWASIGLHCMGFMSLAASRWDYKRNKGPVNDILRINTFVAGACGLVNLVCFCSPHELSDHVRKHDYNVNVFVFSTCWCGRRTIASMGYGCTCCCVELQHSHPLVQLTRVMTRSRGSTNNYPYSIKYSLQIRWWLRVLGLSDAKHVYILMMLYLRQFCRVCFVWIFAILPYYYHTFDLRLLLNLAQSHAMFDSCVKHQTDKMH